METFIYTVWVTIMSITVKPNCPAEDGLYCLQPTVRKVEVLKTEKKEEAAARLAAYTKIVKSDTLIQHVKYAQVFLKAELDSVLKAQDSTNITKSR